MRAVRWHARDDVRLDEVLVPSAGPGQVLLRVEAAAICGTDVDEVRLGPVTVPVEVHPVSGRSAPITLGHEIVGTVIEAGPGAVLPVGTRVAPWPSRPCGRCRECTTGHANRCPNMASLGMSLDGGMADFVVVDEGRCVPLDPDVPTERAVLVEPAAVALHAVHHQVEVTGRRVAVIGIGSLGLLVLEAARCAGAAALVAIGRSEESRAVARAAGATEVAPPDAAGDVDAEIVLETAGATAAIAVATAAVRRGGRVVVLGGHVRPVPVDLLDLTVREIILEGSVSHCFDDFESAVAAITASELAATPRAVQLAPLEAGPALLRTDAGSTKRILVPSLA